MRPGLLFRSLAALSATTLCALAQTLHWNPTGSTVAQGGTGTWSTATAAWNVSSTPSETRFAWTDGNHAVLGGASGTVTLDESVTATGLTFNPTGSYTLAGFGLLNVGGSTNIDGGSLTLAADVTFFTNGNSAIGLGGGIDATVVVNGSWNTIGYLDHAGGNLTLSSGGTVTNSVGYIGWYGGRTATATITGADSTWINSSDIDVGHNGTGSLTIADQGLVRAANGTGTVILGWIADGSGTLNLGAGAAAGTLEAATVTGVAGTAIVNFNHTDSAYTFAPALTGSVAVNHLGSGTTTLSGANSYLGGTTFSGGTLSISNDAALGHIDGPLTFNGGALATTASFTSTRDVTLAASGGTFAPADTTTLTWNGDITGSGDLTKTGLGTLVLGGTNDYSGATSVEAGTLRLGASNVLAATTTLAVAADATFDANDFTQTFAGLSGNGALNLRSEGLSFNVVGNHTFGGVISGGGDLMLSGAGSLTLTGIHTYTGATDLQHGTLTISGGSLGNILLPLEVGQHGGTATLVVSGGAAVVSDGGFLGSFESTGSALVTGAGSVWTLHDSLEIGAEGTGHLTIADAGVVNASDHTLKIGNGTLNLGSGGGAGTLLDGWVYGTSGSAVVNFNHNESAYIFTSELRGELRVNHIGTGTTTLTGSNSNYTGGTTLSAGTLAVSQDFFLGESSGTITFNGGTLATLGSIDSDRATTLEAGGGTFDTAASTTLTWSGSITGPGDLRKIGPGILTLGGTNDYSGDTFVDAGILRLGSSGALSPNTTLVIGEDGLFDGNGYRNAFAGLSGAGALELGAFGLEFNIDGNDTYSGTISGHGVLSLHGAGSLTLTGTNDYTGATVANDLTVSIGADSHLGAPSAPLFLNGATLHTTAGFTSTRALTLETGGGTFDPALGTTLTWNGDVSGGELTKTGAGTLSLGGDNTYAVTFVRQGILAVTGSLAGNDASFIHVGVSSGDNAAMTIADGGTVAVGAVFLGDELGSEGTLRVTGPGTSLTVSSGLVSGLGGAGQLEITGGATVTNVTGVLGFAPGSSGTALVSGAGSTWTNTLLIVGYDSDGTLTIANGGTVVSDNAGPGSVYLGFASSGTINIGTGGSAGTLQAGEIFGIGGPAALNFNHNESSYAMNAVLGGPIAVSQLGSGRTILATSNSYTAGTTVSAGTLEAGADDAFGSGALTMNGGTLALAGFDQTLGALTLAGAAVFDFGSGSSALSFADSSALTWSGTLTLFNYTFGSDTLSFGSATGLTSDQLALVRLSGYEATGLDAGGFMQFSATAVPEPSTYAAIFGAAALGFAVWRQRRARTT